MMNGQRQEKGAAALQRYDNDHEFYGIQERLYKQLILKDIDVVFQSHEVRQLRVQREVVGKAESERKQHRQE